MANDDELSDVSAKYVEPTGDHIDWSAWPEPTGDDDGSAYAEPEPKEATA